MDKSSIRILTADDHQISLRLIERQLGIMGFKHIATASNGEEALRRLEKEPFDIVILDWAMPVKDGLTLLKECRTQEKFKHVAFAMLSSEAQPHMIKEAVDAGATAYIVKPVTQDTFAAKMDEILGWLRQHAPHAGQSPGKAPSGLAEQVMRRTGDELAGAISDSVLKTVETLFGQKMETLKPKAETPPPSSFAVYVTLTQGDGQARLRLVFDRNLLTTLVSDIYPAESLRNDEILKDTASEITNIVCNKIKAFVNQKGFKVEMGFPRAEDPSHPPPEDSGAVSLNFSLVGNTLSVRKLLQVDLS